MLKGYIFICRNAEGVHGKRKVGHPCARELPKPSKDSASLVVGSEKKTSRFWVSGFLWVTPSMG